MPDKLATFLGLQGGQSAAAPLRLLVELAAQFVGAKEGSLLVLDDARGELVFAMTVGGKDAKNDLIGQRVPLGKGITGLAAQTHEVQIGAPTFGVAQAGDPRSVLAAPMLIDDRLIGVTTAVKFRQGKHFSAEDATLYARVAAVAGVLVDQARRLERIPTVRKGKAPPPPAGEDPRLQHEILESVRRILQAKPHA